MAFADQVVQIADPKLQHEAEAASINRWILAQAASRSNTMNCLVSLIRNGVACSMESPQDRMGISAILTELHLIRNNRLRDQANNRHN
ncbi:hypothetical protein SLA2020_251640 [Shorea laevis]